jgi:hypothetical protein
MIRIEHIIKKDEIFNWIQRQDMNHIELATAKLLLERGYNEFACGTLTEYLKNQKDPEYPEGGGPFSMKKGEIEFENGYFRNNSFDRKNKSYQIYSAPTQEVVHQWLIDEHRIFIQLTPSKSKDDLVIWFAQAYTLRNYNMTFRSFSYITMPQMGQTNQEAMEKGIQDTLKWMKI